MGKAVHSSSPYFTRDRELFIGFGNWDNVDVEEDIIFKVPFSWLHCSSLLSSNSMSSNELIIL